MGDEQSEVEEDGAQEIIQREDFSANGVLPDHRREGEEIARKERGAPSDCISIPLQQSKARETNKAST